jgi:tetratricopeptide (TPR) repeat protein
VRNALKIEMQLAADFPTVPQYRHDLARSYNNLGNLLRDQGKRDEAEAAYHDALKIQGLLAAEFPTVPEYRQELALSHSNLGYLLLNQGKRDEARAAHREALKIRAGLAVDFPKVSQYQLAEVLFGLGDHTAAAAAAQQLIRTASDPAIDAYNAACILARCVPLAKGDSKLNSSQREERAQDYANRALALLRQSVQNGYTDVVHIKTDTDLDPLRSHPEFQKLLRELEERMKRRE